MELDFIQKQTLSYKKQMEAILEFNNNQIQRYQQTCKDLKNKIIYNYKYFEEPNKCVEQIRKELTLDSLEFQEKAQEISQQENTLEKENKKLVQKYEKLKGKNN